MAYSLNFTYRMTQNPLGLTQCSVRVDGEITAWTDLVDPGVFVFVINPVTQREVYSHVATPCDYTKWNYQISGGLSFVRQKAFSLHYVDAATAAGAITLFQRELLSLCNSFTLADRLASPITVTITANV